MKKICLLMLTSLLPLMGVAQSDKAFYTEIEHSVHRIKNDMTGAPTYRLNGVGLNLGAIVMENLALEAFLGTGRGDDTQSIYGMPVTVKGGTSYGAYARPFLPLTDKLEWFARFGYVKARSSATAFGVENKTTDESLSYGTGLAYRITDKFAVTASYMVYYDKGGVKADGFTVAGRVSY